MPNASGRKPAGLLVLALLCLLAAGAVGAAAATPAKKRPPKKHAVAAKALCRFGQDTKTCRPNPAFARTVCDTFLPALQSLAPSTSFGKGYFPSWQGDHVQCFWKANGQVQSFGIHIWGGRLFHGRGENSTTLTAASVAASYRRFYESESSDYEKQVYGGCLWPTVAEMNAHLFPPAGQQPVLGPPMGLPTKTAILGHEAWTQDTCQTPEVGVRTYDPAKARYLHRVEVLDGPLWFEVYADAPAVDVTTDRLVPFMEQLIKKYDAFK